MIGILSRNNNLTFSYNQEYNPINMDFIRPVSVLFHPGKLEIERLESQIILEHEKNPKDVNIIAKIC
jgi:hypothetical protein